MSDNHDNRQLSLTMNYYLLSSILIAVCHLTQADEAYGKVRFIACTQLTPQVSCPFTTEAKCDNYCTVLGYYVERLREDNRRCPYAYPPIFCPNRDPRECMTYCNTAANYEKR